MSKKSTQISKKVLASALSAAMVVAFAPAVALADGANGNSDGGAVVSDTDQSLPSAVDGLITIGTSGTYTLTSDVTDSIKVTADNVTLNLGNHTITANKTHAITNRGKNLLINGGTVDGSAVGGAGAIYTAPGASTAVQGSALKGSKWYVLKNLGEITLNQVQLNQYDSDSSAIDNGWYNWKKVNVNDFNEPIPTNADTKVKLTINGGVYDGGLNTVKNDDLGELLITGGTFKNYTQSAFQNHGTATVIDGEFVAESLCAIENCGCDQLGDPGKLTIAGGKFTGLLYVRSSYSDVTVAGGSFDGGIEVTGGSLEVKKGSFTGDITVGKSASLKIDVGTFNTDPSTWVANGSVGHKGSDGIYHVHAANEGVTSSSGSAATCTAAGYTGSTCCSIDGYVYSSSSTIPALGHEYTWVTTTPATESAEGVMTGTCSRCGSTITSPIPKLPASGSNETATDSSGAKIDVTIDTNESVTLPDGTQAAGTATYEASESDAAKAEVVIPSTVAVGSATYVVDKIADSAFEGQEQLASVTIPDTVVEIGASAFAGTSLASIAIPESTTVIGEGAFKGCSSLESVDIKGDVTKIAADTFAGTALTSVDIPDSVATIGARAFADSLIKTVSSQATTVSKSAFAGCSALKSVDLPKAKTIGKNAFKGAGLLKSVTTGTKLASIGKKALSGTSVKKLVLTSKKLTASSVAGSLKGSSVVKVVVKVSGSKKAQEKIVDKYTKAFAKKNSGKKVKVVAAK